jgi:hypothetical protein
MKEQAMICLDDLLNQNPTNTELHFLKGKYCLLDENYYCAESRFKVKAVQKRYGKKISALYKDIADRKINEGDFNTAYALYSKAVQHNPRLKPKIASDLFNLALRNERASNDLLRIAANLDPAVKKRIAEHFYALCNATTGETSLALLKRANYYANGKYSKELKEKELQIGNEYLYKAKLLAKIPGKEKETEANKAKAAKYLGRAVVEQELPEYRIYRPRPEPYTFSLKAGEQTDHWITFSMGEHYFLLNSKDNKFKMLFEDGREIPAWNPITLPEQKNIVFKLIAVSDQQISLKLTDP